MIGELLLLFDKVWGFFKDRPSQLSCFLASFPLFLHSPRAPASTKSLATPLLLPMPSWFKCAHVACLSHRSGGSRLLCLTSIGLARVITSQLPTDSLTALAPLSASLPSQTSNEHRDRPDVTLRRALNLLTGPSCISDLTPQTHNQSSSR